MYVARGRRKDELRSVKERIRNSIRARILR